MPRWSQAVGSVGRWAQRRGVHVPGPLQRTARALLVRSASTGEGPDDWSSPLVGGGPLRQPPRPVPPAPPPGPAAASAGQVARCLIVTGSLDVGGMESVVAFLARGLPRQGIATSVLHTGPHLPPPGAPPGHLARELMAEGVPVELLPEEAGRALLESTRPDVISAHGAPAWVLREAVRLGIPVVEMLHGSNVLDVAWNEEAARSRHLSGVVAVNEALRRRYLDYCPALPDHLVETVPNSVLSLGTDDDLRPAARAWLGLTDEFLFVSLSRFSMEKNPFALVEAFGEVAARHSDAHLLVAGRCDDPVYYGHLARLRERLPGGARVHLREHSLDTDALLAAADGFVLDSFLEGGPLVTMEALVAGVPVVSSRVGAVDDQLGADGRRGYVVPAPLGTKPVTWESMRDARFARQSNRGELVAAMERLVEDRSCWAESRQRLRAESVELFHPDRCLAAHARVLLRAAGKESTTTAAQLGRS